MKAFLLPLWQRYAKWRMWACIHKAARLQDRAKRWKQRAGLAIEGR